MTCQECEIKLGMGEDAEEHLASCAECRSLAEELRLNAFALREMRVRPRPHWEWALAAAAAILLALGVWRTMRADTLRVQPAVVAHISKQDESPLLPPPVKHLVRSHKAGHGPAPQPLQVKMFTSDPDVVIYWIVDRKEGFE